MSNPRSVAFTGWSYPRGTKHIFFSLFPSIFFSSFHFFSFLFLCMVSKDIDGRFGVLSVHLREKSIETPQKFFSQAKAAFVGECEITYVNAIHNYKKYYDFFSKDSGVSVRKKEFTNLGNRIERLTEEEKAKHPYMLQTKLNYRKHGQDVGVVLRPLNPLYNGVSESRAEVFYPVIVQSVWMPQGSFYEEDQAIGIQYMTEWPTGTPEPEACEPWSNRYRLFMNSMQNKYPLATEQHIFASWNDHLREHMPIKPDSNPPIPSDDIHDYMRVHGSSFSPPLSKYLYGPSPIGFDGLHAKGWKSSNPTPTVSTSLDTAFTGDYDSRSSWVDVMKSVVQQHHQSVEHVRNKYPFKRWVFDCPEMMQGVIVPVKTFDPTSKKYYYPLQPGRIVAFCDDDQDSGPMFRVCFVLY